MSKRYCELKNVVEKLEVIPSKYSELRGYEALMIEAEEADTVI